VLSDPRRLAAAAVRGGLGSEFAAAWLVVAHRAPRPASTVSLPSVLLGDGPVIEIAPGLDGDWQRRVIRQAPGRDLSTLNGPLPAGRLLEELLLGAALRHDLPMLRRLLSGWIAALPEATPDNVVVHQDSPSEDVYRLLDPTLPAQTDVLRRFAQTLLGGGYAHPWPAATDLQTLTSILHGAAGLPDTVPAVEPGDEPPLPDSRREHEEQLRALRRQLADAASRSEWYERELDRREKQLRKRDKELDRARLQISAFSGTVSYRVAKLGVSVARKARNQIRKGLS